MLESLQTLLDPVSYVSLIVVTVSILLAGFIRGFVGFGAALILVMVLSAVFGPVVNFFPPQFATANAASSFRLGWLALPWRRSA